MAEEGKGKGVSAFLNAPAFVPGAVSAPPVTRAGNQTLTPNLSAPAIVNAAPFVPGGGEDTIRVNDVVRFESDTCSSRAGKGGEMPTKLQAAVAPFVPGGQTSGRWVSAWCMAAWGSPILSLISPHALYDLRADISLDDSSSAVYYPAQAYQQGGR